jgi:hypothetical protein
MAGVRPEEARAIGREEDVDLDGNPPSVAVLRADRAGGDTKTPRSRRALKLAQMAAGALREWQVDQAAERAAAGSHWQDTGRAGIEASDTYTSVLPEVARKAAEDVDTLIIQVGCLIPGTEHPRQPGVHQAGLLPC